MIMYVFDHIIIKEFSAHIYIDLNSILHIYLCMGIYYSSSTQVCCICSLYAYKEYKEICRYINTL